MSAARLTVAEARALGLDTSTATKAATTSTRSRRAVTGPAPWRCSTCGLTDTGETSAARHNVDTHHGRYEVPVEVVAS